jgi:hypothetical protein
MGIAALAQKLLLTLCARGLEWPAHRNSKRLKIADRRGAEWPTFSMLLTRRNAASNPGRVAASCLKSSADEQKIARRRGLGKISYLRNPLPSGWPLISVWADFNPGVNR